jgi:hypothetical protein
MAKVKRSRSSSSLTPWTPVVAASQLTWDRSVAESSLSALGLPEFPEYIDLDRPVLLGGRVFLERKSWTLGPDRRPDVVQYLSPSGTVRLAVAR